MGGVVPPRFEQATAAPIPAESVKVASVTMLVVSQSNQRSDKITWHWYILN